MFFFLINICNETCRPPQIETLKPCFKLLYSNTNVQDYLKTKTTKTETIHIFISKVVL